MPGASKGSPDSLRPVSYESQDRRWNPKRKGLVGGAAAVVDGWVRRVTQVEEKAPKHQEWSTR